MSLSERSLAKARRLADEGRVVEVTATRTFTVDGDHDVTSSRSAPRARTAA